MLKTKILAAISILILATLACKAILPTAEPIPTVIIEIEPSSTPPADQLPQTEADVPRVSLEEAYVALNAGAATFVDVRSADSYAASHVAGAINIPVELIEANPNDIGLDKDQWIITYCT